MGTERVELGRWGEEIAARHLVGMGMSIVDRNWRCRAGEIDIIARDGDDIVICEVKTRSTEYFGIPVAAVTPRKVRRLRRLAAEWLAQHQGAAAHVRIDVIGVLRRTPGDPVIEHVCEVD